jgi:deoxyribodipyrimidine photolyase-like uncharacterized protein
MKTLRLILGDQLNIRHSWFKESDKNVIYLMAEMRQETDYVKHHIQKVIAFFLSMRNFADVLEAKGHVVDYLKIGNRHNPQNLETIIFEAINRHKIEKFESATDLMLNRKFLIASTFSRREMSSRISLRASNRCLWKVFTVTCAKNTTS